MKRRGFLATLAAVTAATAMDVLGLKAAAAPKPALCVPNPAYAAAQFEMHFVMHPQVAAMLDLKAPKPHWDAEALGYRPSGAEKRYNFVNGQWVEVTRFIQVEEPNA